jgi:hypothetical protein
MQEQPRDALGNLSRFAVREGMEKKDILQISVEDICKSPSARTC